MRSSATSFLSDFSLDGDENMFENNRTHKLLFKIKTYLFYILIALAFILYKLYKVNLEI